MPWAVEITGVLVIACAGCSTLQQYSAAQIGCDAKTVEVSHTSRTWSTTLWTAECGGQSYQCSATSTAWATQSHCVAGEDARPQPEHEPAQNEPEATEPDSGESKAEQKQRDTEPESDQAEPEEPEPEKSGDAKEGGSVQGQWGGGDEG